VAIGAVLLAHAGLPFATGGYIGVDVFFVISGFLITGLLMRELQRTGRISFREFYARRVRRLMPMAALVLVFIAVMSWILYSPVRNELVAIDILAAALYVVNWRFASQSVDYFAEGLETSPVQHFWSLSIEEQYYLVWPALLIVATIWFIRNGSSIKPVVVAMLALLIGGSLAWSVIDTEQAQTSAYFSTLTRVWELAAGGLLSVLATKAPPRWLANILICAGIAAIAAATVLYGPDTTFPGYAALLPVIGTLALIWAGTGGQEVGATRVLTVRPMRYLGRVSYNSYLWHWPFLIFAADIIGRELTPVEGLGVIALSFIPVAISHRYVERPLHESTTLKKRPLRAAGLWAGTTASVVIAVVALSTSQETIPEAVGKNIAGADAIQIQNEPQKTAEALRPRPETARDDLGPWRDCMAGFEQTETPDCVVAGNEDSEHTVVVFGDSHVDQWSPAFAEIAQRRDWQVIYLVKTGCGPADVRNVNANAGRVYHECFEWRQNAYNRIAELEPDMVIVGTTSGYTPLDENDELLPEDPDGPRRPAMIAAFKEMLELMQNSAGEVVVMADIPAPLRAGVQVADCVAKNMDDFSGCGFSPDDSTPDSYSHNDMLFDVTAADQVPGVTLVDMRTRLCPDNYCRAVIGDALVFRDDTHITATIAETLADAIDNKLPEL